MYERYSRRQGWKLELLERQDDPPRLIVFRVAGRGTQKLHGEGGVHKVQHKTRSRRHDRIHTSVVTVAVLDPPPNPERSLDMSDVRVDAFRGHGAGGQHRNVTDSAIRATHLPSGEAATVTSGRSQAANREAALSVLAGRLAARQEAVADHRVNMKRKRQAGHADRAGAGRIYDRVRDMIRTRDGQKFRGVERVLAGDLDPLLDGQPQAKQAGC